MTSFIDTHCHLDLLKIDPEVAIQKAKAAQVELLVTIGVDIPSLAFVEYAVKQWASVYGSVGIHPHEAKYFNPEVVSQIRNLAHSVDKIVAIGETGLDYHYMHSSQEIQQRVFRQQLQIAEDLQLPVVLHTREAEYDTLAILKENPVTRKGVAHSFTGSAFMLGELLELGWLIGINGIATFRGAEELRRVIREIPLDRLLLETDAPFLTPMPNRGRPNEPSTIPLIAQFLATEWGLSLEKLSQQTNENAKNLFQFKEKTP
ncbi:TatD family hydrolase [Deltaproteobacteria bacterium TL4]